MNCDLDMRARVDGWKGANRELLAGLVDLAEQAMKVGDASLAHSLLMLVSNRTHDRAQEELASIYR